MSVVRLEIEGGPTLADARADAVRQRVQQWLDLEVDAVRSRKVYLLDLGLEGDEPERVLEALVDPVAEHGCIGGLDDATSDGAPWIVEVGFAPGVTDAVGRSVKRAAEDAVGRSLEGEAYSAMLYRFWGVEKADVERIAAEILHNPLIERALISTTPREPSLAVPAAGAPAQPTVERVALRDASDETLETISREGSLSLSLAEMHAIQAHFDGLGRDPTDAELEVLAQTWSEHCKHKIFASPIDYTDPDGARRTLESGLFRTHIRGATEAVRAQREADGADPFLVSVFHDNAGVVTFTDRDHLVYKVETHNSPSALDPYGGAMTGIVGVNRDSFGTGLGADLLTNVWGYCLGDPRHAGALPKGLMHPRRIRDGVHEGVIDGGNHSGIPYSRGFEVFDARYAGKPLVYCGTVAVMPVESAGRPTHAKYAEPGHKIVMVGGRIGKDGIHGATFSSAQLDESAPVQAVQIGDPIVQKMMWDFLTEAREQGLYSSLTDNGAGGLSSSVGEMAEATHGARIDLALAPLKYPGLAPWEILVSEAQERMTLAVPPEHLDALLALARRREVEASVLGEFTDHGRFEVMYGDQSVCDLTLEFLHDGVPLPTLEARWEPPAIPEDARTTVPEEPRLGETVEALLRRSSVASGERRARHYDHEVKGLSVVKPWVGVRADVPSTGTVLRARHGRDEGVVLGEGIQPFYSDIDTDAMAKACVDEGLRRVLAAGARLDRIAALDNFCWPDPIVSDRTPDGRHKLAQLVRCCEGLDVACRTYGVPLISGKDSMKNDAFLDGVKISIPPTLLVSVMGQLEDVRRAYTLEPRAVGDRIVVLGGTRDELGGTEYARLRELVLDTVPRTDLEANHARYVRFVEARDAGLVRSVHVPARGGLAVALAHMALACDHSLRVNLAAVHPDPRVALFSESTGRFVVTVSPDSVEALAKAFGDDFHDVGEVVAGDPGAALVGEGLELSRSALFNAFQEGLADV